MISLEQTVSDLSGRQFGLALLRTSASSVSSTVRCSSPEELSMPNNLPLTLTGAAAALRAGTVTSVQLTEASITRADELDGQLGVYLARFDEYAMAAAAQADAELGGGVDRGPLHGIPCAVKDILAMAEGPTTVQSLILDPAWDAGWDAPVVSRQKRLGQSSPGRPPRWSSPSACPTRTSRFHSRATRGTPRPGRVARAPGPAPGSRRACSTWASAPTPSAASASPRGSAA